MLANRILEVFLRVLAWIVLPLAFLTTFVLGLLVEITFGLLLVPLSLIWIVLFLGPLLVLSWLWQNVPVLRILVGILGVPVAVLGYVYTCLIPCMGEWESRFSKLALCSTFPFTLDCWALLNGKKIPTFDKSDDLGKVLLRLRRTDPPLFKYLVEIGVHHLEAEKMHVR